MKRFPAMGFAIVTLAGCMGPRIYLNDLPKNLNVVTTVDGGSTKVEVAFDVHAMKQDCKTDFIGRINVENGEQAVGLPTGKPLYLEFVFVSGEFLNSNVGAVRQGTILTPQVGASYKADVYYKKGIYDVVLYEGRNGVKGREIPLLPLGSCKRAAPGPV